MDWLLMYQATATAIKVVLSGIVLMLYESASIISKSLVTTKFSIINVFHFFGMTSQLYWSYKKELTVSLIHNIHYCEQ